MLGWLLLGSRLNTQSGSKSSAYSTFRSHDDRHSMERHLALMAWNTLCRLTGYGANLLCALASHHENDVSLRRVDIVILEEEWLIDAVFLQCAEFDNQANGARQGLFDDQILLASNLEDTLAVNCTSIGGANTYALKEMKEISTGLVGNFLRVDGLCGRVCCHHIFECVVGR